MERPNEEWHRKLDGALVSFFLSLNLGEPELAELHQRADALEGSDNLADQTYLHGLRMVLAAYEAWGRT